MPLPRTKKLCFQTGNLYLHNEHGEMFVARELTGFGDNIVQCFPIFFSVSPINSLQCYKLTSKCGHLHTQSDFTTDLRFVHREVRTDITSDEFLFQRS